METETKNKNAPGYIRIIFDSLLQFLRAVGVALIPLIILLAICIPVLAVIIKLIVKEFIYFWQIIPA